VRARTNEEAFMLDHIGIRVQDFAKSKAFYSKALAPLGYTVIMDFGEGAGLGAEGKPDFWLGPGQANGPIHIAFAAKDQKTVDAFYAAAIAAGGKDNGKPGLRKEYHPTYYGAFVLDPDGNNVEAVCHKPE
jgi:catechol 2,3-dioxygenase-like lactoylglutathione lyase family enzyme